MNYWHEVVEPAFLVIMISFTWQQLKLWWCKLRYCEYYKNSESLIAIYSTWKIRRKPPFGMRGPICIIYIYKYKLVYCIIRYLNTWCWYYWCIICLGSSAGLVDSTSISDQTITYLVNRKANYLSSTLSC